MLHIAGDGFLTVGLRYCIRCRSLDLQTLRSVHNQGDGSRLQRVRCRDCLFAFSVIYEPPNFGKPGEDDLYTSTDTKEAAT